MTISSPLQHSRRKLLVTQEVPKGDCQDSGNKQLRIPRKSLQLPGCIGYRSGRDC